MKKAEIPPNLGKEGSAFWLNVLAENEIEDSHDLQRLAMACKCLDDLAIAEGRVIIEGMFIQNRYGNITEHPAVKTVRDTRLLFVKIIREMGLDLVDVKDTRPPRQY